MPLNREQTLAKVDDLLRTGKLQEAIRLCGELVDERPADWNAINTLGDLYARAGAIERAVAQYTRVADHFDREGFFARAAALYKKVLRIAGDHEPAMRRLADLAARQGLAAEAAQYREQLARLRGGRPPASTDTSSAGAPVEPTAAVRPAKRDS